MRVIVDKVDEDFLITGDRDFSEARKFGRTKIISVSQFNRLVCEHSA